MRAFTLRRDVIIVEAADVFVIGRFRFEHRTSAVLTGVDGEYRSQRDRHVAWYPAKARVEAHFVVRQLEIAYRTRGNIENDLPIARVLHRHEHARQRHIHHQVRRQLVIQQPVIKRP